MDKKDSNAVIAALFALLVAVLGAYFGWLGVTVVQISQSITRVETYATTEIEGIKNRVSALEFANRSRANPQ